MADKAADAKKKDDAAKKTWDPEQLKKTVKAVEKQEEELLSRRGEYMSACKPHHERIREIKDNARKIHGIPSKQLNAVLAKRALDQKAEKLRADMKPEDLPDYDKMLKSLGDFGTTGLGAAALAKAKPPEKPAEPDLRPRHLRGEEGQEEADRIAAENKAKLEAGIKPIAEKAPPKLEAVH